MKAAEKRNVPNDVHADIGRLYKALAAEPENMNTARMLHAHLKKVHNLDARGIRKNIETLCLTKTTEVTQQALRKSH